MITNWKIFGEVGRKVVAGDMDKHEATRRLISAGWKPNAASKHVDRWLQMRPERRTQ